MDIQTLLQQAVERKASDLHLMGGEVPRVRISGDLVELESPSISSDDLRELLKQSAPRDFESRLDRAEAVEWNLIEGDLSFSGIAHRTEGQGLAATFRIFSNQIPSLDKVGLGLEPVIERVLNAPSGIAIFAGETNSGKWTVVGSLIAALNEKSAARIFVVSSCANFAYKRGKGLVTQLFVGQDCASYAKALDIAHASDLDVVAIDDVPNLDVLRQALLLAEVGHLVVFNLHAPDPVSAIERMVETAGIDAPSLLRSLAKNLIVVNSQRLVQRKDQPGRAPLYQWIANGPEVREALLAGDFTSLKALQSDDPSCQTEEQAWEYMIAAGYVEPNAPPAFPR